MYRTCTRSNLHAHDFWQSSQPLPAQTALQLLEALRAAQFTKVASAQAQDAVSDGAEKAEQAICESEFCNFSRSRREV